MMSDKLAKHEERVSRYFSQGQVIRRRDIVLAIVPALVIVSLLGYSVYELRGAQGRIADLHQEIATRDGRIEQARAELRAALIQKRYVREVDGRDVRAMRRNFPKEADLLAQILDSKESGIEWVVGSSSAAAEHDSPSFVQHVLREQNLKMGYLPLSPDPQEASLILFENLRYEEKPNQGDLVFYRAGFVFFHFHDRRGRPFVIGMTPYGVLALDPEFSDPVGFRSFWYAGSIEG